MAETSPEGKRAPDHAEILAVLESENISVFFQPVVSVRNRGILGFEAFSRSQTEQGARLDAHDLFGHEWDPEIRLRLCRLCRRKALQAFRPIFARHPQMLLFLNTDGGALSASSKPGHLEALSEGMQIPGRRVVIELERAHLSSPDVARFIAYYRQRGFGLSVDMRASRDVPAEELFAFRPDFVKFDRHLFTEVEGRDYKREAVASLARLCERLGCVPLGKNVETEDEALRLLEWGVQHQQGFYYTREQGQGEQDPIRAFQRKVEEINRRYREHALAAVAAKRKCYEEHHKTLKRAGYKLADAAAQDFAQACERLALTEESVVCAYVLSEDGVQLTPRAFKRSLSPETPLLGPERGRGTDYGLREDVLHLKSGFDRYVLPELVSPHAKVTVCTMSERFYGTDGQPAILCLELLCT